MNKRNVEVAMLTVLLIVPTQLWAQEQPKTVASQVNRVSTFNEVTDYLATAGKSKLEQDTILAQRREERRLKRLRALQRKKQLAIQKLERNVAQRKESSKGWRDGSYEK